MKYRLVAFLLMAVAFLWVGSALITACASDDPPRMTKEELNGRLGDPEVVVVDVRVRRFVGRQSRPRSRGPCERIQRESRVGSRNIPRTRHWSSTAREAMSTPVPVWHRNSKDHGYTKVYALKGGWKDWEKAGLPTEQK